MISKPSLADTKGSNVSALVEELGGDSNDSDDEASVVRDANDTPDGLQCGKCSFVAHGKLRTALIYHHTGTNSIDGCSELKSSAKDSTYDPYLRALPLKERIGE